MQLQQHTQAFTERQVTSVVITFEAGFLARSYVEETGLLWPLLIDDRREVYRAYNMLQAGFWDIWGPRTWRAYVKELAHGHRPHKTQGDVNQRGGDVLIDPSGLVRLHHVGAGPADRPTVRDLLRLLD